MDYSKTIYKKDSKGKIRVLTVSAKDGEIIQESGLLNGKLTIRSKMAKPKNVGRVNATTIEEQAILEAEALIVKNKKVEYFDTISEAENSEMVLYMGAKEYPDYKHKIKQGTLCFLSRKYDGMRCLAHVIQGVSVKMLSRENTDLIDKYNSMMHLVPQLIQLPTGIYDGELFNMKLGTFQKQMKAIKKYRAGISEQIDFNVYDMYHATDDYKQRFETFTNNIQNILGLDTNIQIAPQNIFSYVDEQKESAEEFVKKIHDIYVAEGFEGAILRVSPNLYECNKKSMQMLKIKEFYDIAAEIIDIIPQDADPTKGQVIAKAIEEVQGVKIGTQFKSGCAVDHEEQQNMLTNKQDYIGKIGEFRFFEKTDDGDLRHAHYHGLRLDK